MTLKMLRAERNLNLEDFASKTGVSIPTLRKLELIKPIASQAVFKIAKAFKVIVEIHPNGNIEYRKP